MEGGIHVDAPLDYVSFHVFPTENRYEAFICRDDQIEKLASDILEQLRLHLPEVKKFHLEGLDGHMKLQLPEKLKRSTWFSKSTISRFLHIVGTPELLKIANAIGDEMSQLKESRRFHLDLYTQGRRNDSQTEETDCCNTEGMEPTKKPDRQIVSSDATKNELLRAMDVRLTTLKEEWVTAFNQAADATCSTEQITDLLTFSQHFGAEHLRNCLLKYLDLTQKNQCTTFENEQPKLPQNFRSGSGELKDAISQVSPTVKSVLYGASPAKAAQVERHSSTESEDSCNSSDEDKVLTERSRPLIRSASPRRSASPMRRIQIGRSGSHRAPALTIKSLSYFPGRERISSNKDADGDSSEEGSDLPLKKPASNSRSISVQDAISLFERKQRDESSDLQRRRFSADTSVSTNKSVLRRWSGRAGDSFSQCLTENACDGGVHINPNNLGAGETQKNPVKEEPESDLIAEAVETVKIGDVGEILTGEEKESSGSADKLADTVSAPVLENHNRVSASLDWSRQKEDELNHMMMKMMEIKPIRNQRMANGVSRSQELSGGQRGGSYDQYKKKRDEKVRENSGKRIEEQFKTFQEILDQRKAEMASKAMGVAGKQDSPVKSQKPQKKTSPSVQPKLELSKPIASRKTPPKASSLPATRKSWPSTPSPRTAGITPSKTTNGLSSAGTTTTRRKSQPTPSATQPRPKVERSQKPKESTKATSIENKRSLKSQEGKIQQSLANVKTTKTKDMQTSGNSSGKEPAKPSFYNKVTKKGSVVPLESKPFLRKRSGTGPGVSPVAKTKAPHSEESVKSSKNNIEAQQRVVAEIPKPVIQQEVDVVHPVDDVVDLEPKASEISHKRCEDIQDNDHLVSEGDDSLQRTAEFPVEIQPDEVSSISPTAWVEIEEHQELPGDSCPQIGRPTKAESEALSSPRVRHSLSQMLQEDSGEPEILEWGNAENPPAIIYQKDVPKGLKRLLKFARKSKGEANITGWSSPSVFSEGEEDAEESRDANSRQADAISRKASLQAKGGKQRSSFAASNYGGNSSKGAIDSSTASDLLSAQSNMSRFAAQSSNKLQDSHIAATSTKSSRSFFSLSTFRSSK